MSISAEQYQPQLIETDAQLYWEKNKCFRAQEDLSKEKFYCLAMFPYPSGNLHMGHVRCYVIDDVIARNQIMRGKNVLHPMGWDAFGLPAENAAIQHKTSPAEWTYKNIDDMRDQLKRLGLGYDWKREITTCKPEYYRWEQWLFLKMFEKGLAYRKNSVVNWDPVDQTVLANEQVIDGRGWRSGALVERREIPQWFLKITAYADELIQDLDKLEHWPAQVKTMQRNWIGRSEGLEITFPVESENTSLKIFTTRADTLMGASYLAIAPQHPLALKAAEKNPLLKEFIEECRHIQVSEASIATLEKKGLDTGLFSTHPVTGELLPIWVANFVLMDYGSGAVMSVPAHDQRDFEFAKKYHLPIKPVIETSNHPLWDYEQTAMVEKGHLIKSGEFTGLESDQAIEAIENFLQAKNLGKKEIHYRLRDWGVSRQRYWGAPIPIVYCKKCGPVGVPEEQLPVILPENIEFTGVTSPLKTLPEFYQTTCPKCGEAAERETDTFDTFIESSWYYARYSCVDQSKDILDDRARYWTPVNQYVGGIEHAVLHLLYARFFHKVLRDFGFLNCDEPFERLLTQGMVLKNGAKMSKSKGNVVGSNQFVEEFGADTARLFMLFAAPPEQSLEWSDAGAEGCHRFLKRLWNFAYQHQNWLEFINTAIVEDLTPHIEWEIANSEILEIRKRVYEILKQANSDFEKQQFNTVVSACMKLFNLLTEMVELIAPEEFHEEHALASPLIRLSRDTLSILLRLLSPICPHIAHYLWKHLSFGENILRAKWPKVIAEALKVDHVDIVVQVNGKLRGKLRIASQATQQEVEQAALALENIQKTLQGQNIKKVIWVPGKLVNIVI